MRLNKARRRPELLALASACAVLAAAEAASAAPRCSPATIRAVLAPATSESDEVALACSLRLKPGDVVTRRIVIEGSRASGTTLDCGGGAIGRSDRQPAFPDATIEIRSAERRRGGMVEWDRPSDVTIRNCAVLGPIRVWGMGRNGQDDTVRLSSRSLGHTERTQAAAPTRIRIERSRLEASGAIPLYLGPGVTEATLSGSTVVGRSGSTAIYLDAESARNVIRGNVFDIDTGREVIAVDGSASNVVERNVFTIARQGGVFLYRNCGEGGTVRHQTPSGNLIRANRFRYVFYPHFAAVSVGARSGWGIYCEEDAGYPFGSSADNGDGATGNTVDGNVVEEGWGARPPPAGP